MTSRTRLLLKILAWTAFLVTAPLIIGYSLGHRVDPRSPVPTTVGTFLVETEPRGATVFIRDRPHSDRTPTAVRSLVPGVYRVRIEKEGYRSWEKELRIRGTRVTDIRHIRLVPQDVEEDIVRGNVLDSNISPRERWLAVTERAGNAKRLRIVPFDRFTESGVVVPAAFGRSERLAFLWSPDEERLLIEGTRGGRRRAWVVNPSTGEATPLESAPEVLGWLPGDARQLIVKRGDVVTQQAVEGTAQPTVIAHAALGAAVGSRNVVIASSAAEGQTSDAERRKTDRPAPPETGAEIRVFSGIGTVQETFPAPPGMGTRPQEMAVSPFADVAVVGETGELFLWESDDRAWRTIAARARDLQWSPDGEKLLWQESDFDVWVVNVRERRTPLPEFVPELVVRLSVPVRGVRWFAGSQHLLFLQRDVVELADIDGRDGHRIESLLGTNRGDGVVWAADGGETVYADVKRDGEFALARVFLLTPSDR